MKVHEQVEYSGGDLKETGEVRDSQHWIKLLSWPPPWTTLRNPIKCSQIFPNRHKRKTSSTFCWPQVVPWVLTSLSLCNKSYIREIPGQEAK